MGVDHPIPARWNRNRLMISGKIFYWSCDWYECQVNDILKRSIDTLRLIIFIPSRVPISPRNTQVLTDSLAASRNDHDNNKTLECRSFIICFRHNESNRWGSCRVKNQRNVEFLWSRCKYLITRIVTYATFLVLILRHCFTFLWFRYFSLIIAEEDHWRIPGKWTHWKATYTTRYRPPIWLQNRSWHHNPCVEDHLIRANVTHSSILFPECAPWSNNSRNVLCRWAVLVWAGGEEEACFY